MSSAALDRLLAILIAAQVLSGLLSLRAGVPATAPLFWLHGLLGGALLVAAVEKLRRSVGPALRRRRWRRLALGALLEGYDPGADLSQFVHVSASGGGTMVSVDPTGHGEFHDLVLLEGVAGVDLAALTKLLAELPVSPNEDTPSRR